jgi:hypothetical protein
MTEKDLKQLTVSRISEKEKAAQLEILEMKIGELLLCENTNWEEFETALRKYYRYNNER